MELEKEGNLKFKERIILKRRNLYFNIKSRKNIKINGRGLGYLQSRGKFVRGSEEERK